MELIKLYEDTLKVIDPGLLEQEWNIKDNTDGLWLIINPDELSEHNHILKFRDSYIKQCSNAGHETSIEIYKDYYFITVNLIIAGGHQFEFEEINLFCGKNYIVSVMKGKTEFLKRIVKSIQESDGGAFYKCTSQVHKVLYIILDRLTVNCFNSISEVEKKLAEMEENIIKENSKKNINHFLTTRRQVFRIRRYVKPLQYVGDMLILNEIDIFNFGTMKYLNNVHMKFNQLENGTEQLYQSVMSLREAYEAEVSNQANEIMKLFTIISAIFLPLNLIAGIFGMNFEYIPMMGHRAAFWGVLVLFVLLASVMVVLFKKRRWL